MKALLLSLALAVSAQTLANQGVKSADKSSQLDDLIRGEMAAVRSYDEVLGKMTDTKEKERLQSMRKDHADAVMTLKKYATADIKEDTKTAGPWGSFVEAYTGGAKLFGNKTAMRALNQGEEHGVKEYEEALEDENITADLKQKIKTQLLPKQKEHVSAIKSFI